MSIVSKTITRKLLTEGIVGKAIYRKHRINSKKSYNLFQVVKFKNGENVYVVSQKGGEQAEEPLWSPSFIDAGIWEQAVSRFPSFERLDHSVEKYLLPEMEDYLQGISDAELVSLTRNFLIKYGVINTPIRQHQGKTYFFDENEVYSLDKKSELFPYEKRMKYRHFIAKYETCFNMNVWSKASSRFEVGMTLNECIGIFLQTELTHTVPQEPSPIDRLVQYIAPPVYERVPENCNESTFDHIRITVGLPRYRFNSWKALKNEVKKNQHELYQRVIQKLAKDRQFKKYGVPINFLKLSSVMLLRDFSMEFIFELKEQKTGPVLLKVATISESEGTWKET